MYARRWLVAALVAVFVLPSSAVAEGQWTEPSTPDDNPSGTYDVTNVVVDRSGRAIMFAESSGLDDPTWAFRRSATGSWGDPVLIARRIDYLNHTVDDLGTVRVVYRRSDGAGKFWLEYRQFRDSTGWSAPSRLTPVGVDGVGGQIDTNAQGRTLITYTTSNPDGSDRRMFSVVRRADDTWEPRVRHLPTQGNTGYVGWAQVDDTGREAIGWWEQAHSVMLTRRRDAGGAWSTPVRVASGIVPPAVARFEDGQLTVGMLRSVGADRHAVFLRRQRADRSWTALQQVTPSAHDAKAFRMVLDPQQRASFLWHGPGDCCPTYLRTRRTDGSWTAPERVPAPALGSERGLSLLGVSGDGTLHLIGNALSPDHVEYRSRPVGGAWSTAFALDDDASKAPPTYARLYLSVAPNGAVAAAWQGSRAWLRVRSAG